MNESEAVERFDIATKRFANAVAYMGEVMAMDALNRDRLNDGLALAYDESAFEKARKAWDVGEAYNP